MATVARVGGTGRRPAGARPAPRGQTPALADPEAAARRIALRAERVASGLDELSAWLTDQIRGGIADLPRLGYPHFDRIAARMVDAQAPGIAGLLRAVPSEFAYDGWPERVLEIFGSLHLLIAAHRKIDELSPELAATVRSRVGYPVGKDLVRAEPAVSDRWFAVATLTSTEFRLDTRRVWLHGQRTGRWAMLLSFAPPGGFLETPVVPGQQVIGGLHFYPGSGQHRALIAVGAAIEGTPGPADVRLSEVADDVTATRRAFADLLATDPWATRLPTVLAGIPIPAAGARPWRLRTAADVVVDLVTAADPAVWTLLARSCGQPERVFGEWDGRRFRPLAVLADERVPELHAVTGEAA